MSPAAERGATPIYQQKADDVAIRFGVDARRGLSEAEALARFERFGANELTAERPVAEWVKFLAQFQDVLVVLLLVATVISAGLWLYKRKTPLPYEAVAIAAVVLLNTIMGYIQEARAEAAVTALRQMGAAQARVIRNGERRNILATQIVPGDIILIDEGDTIPADARLLQAFSLQVVEVGPTGECLPASKDAAPLIGEIGIGERRNMVSAGGRAMFVSTGMGTEVGHIAGMLKEAPNETTPLQKELDRVDRTLGAAVLVIAVAMIATIIIVDGVRGFSGAFAALILGIAFAVAAVPEGLPAILTAVLTVGVHRIARRNAIIRHVAAVETLGSANVIASDKTGALARNEMTVRTVATKSGRVTLLALDMVSKVNWRGMVAAP